MKKNEKKDQETSPLKSPEELLKEQLKEAGSDEEKESLKAELEAKGKEASENYDKYVRALADLENYKKRAAKEKADLIQYGNENLLRDILPVIDSLDRALDSAATSKNFDSFCEGMKMVRDKLLGTLEKYGVEPIDACGKDFDPNVHDAMLEVASDEHEEKKIVDEYERGYLLKGRLLRPSRVSVCKRKNQS